LSRPFESARIFGAKLKIGFLRRDERADHCCVIESGFVHALRFRQACSSFLQPENIKASKSSPISRSGSTKKQKAASRSNNWPSLEREFSSLDVPEN
jgi:hypothetical protein